LNHIAVYDKDGNFRGFIREEGPIPFSMRDNSDLNIDPPKEKKDDTTESKSESGKSK
jgi:hypothetical protein